jgi:hypothetical protein
MADPAFNVRRNNYRARQRLPSPAHPADADQAQELTTPHHRNVTDTVPRHQAENSRQAVIGIAGDDISAYNLSDFDTGGSLAIGGEGVDDVSFRDQAEDPVAFDDDQRSDALETQPLCDRSKRS